MKVYSRVVFVAVVAILFGALNMQSVVAQNAAVSAYSPYTMFGIGELQTIGTAQMRA
mgnify:FL=1